MVQKVQMWKLSVGEGIALLRVTAGFKAYQSDLEPGSFLCSSAG